SILPKSWSRSSVSSRWKWPLALRSIAVSVTAAMPWTTAPAKTYSPNIVVDHVRSSDISQSYAADVNVIAKVTTNAAEYRFRRLWHSTLERFHDPVGATWRGRAMQNRSTTTAPLSCERGRTEPSGRKLWR